MRLGYLGQLGDNPPPYDQATLIPSLGMYALPYATVWPDLATQLLALYRDQVQYMPWLPAGWYDSVAALHGQNGYILIPGPAIYSGSPLPFLTTPDQVSFWTSFNQAAASIISQYAAGQQAAGAAALQQLYANAAFWNTGFGATMINAQQSAYNIADAAGNVVSAAGNIAKAAGKVASFSLSSPTMVIITALGGLGLFLYLKTRK
jgi:hypothetical protein